MASKRRAVGRGPAAQRGLGVDATGAGHDHRRRQHLREVGLEVVAAGAQPGDRGVDAVEGLVEAAGSRPTDAALRNSLCV